MEVDFIMDFISDTVKGMKPAEIKTLIYREGGIELAPGSIVKCIIPDRLLDHKRTIVIDGQEKEITVKGILHDGDPVVVGRYSEINKYVILEKANA